MHIITGTSWHNGIWKLAKFTTTAPSTGSRLYTVLVYSVHVVPYLYIWHYDTAYCLLSFFVFFQLDLCGMIIIVFRLHNVNLRTMKTNVTRLQRLAWIFPQATYAIAKVSLNVQTVGISLIDNLTNAPTLFLELISSISNKSTVKKGRFKWPKQSNCELAVRGQRYDRTMQDSFSTFRVGGL